MSAMTSAVMAGEVADFSKEVLPVQQYNPYFIGGTVGYLDKMDTEFFSLHFGKDLNCKLCNWTQSLFLEVGYASPDLAQSQTITTPSTTVTTTVPPLSSSALPTTTTTVVPGSTSTIGLNYDFKIVPVTLNYKLEREIFNRVNFYAGAGIGAAFTESEFTVNGTGPSESETEFFAQGFTGLVYNMSEKWEIFGGARYIWFEEPGNTAWQAVEAANVAKNGDWLGEIGLRFNF